MGFECFRRARAFGKLRNDEVKAASCGLLNLRTMFIELFAGDKCSVEVGAVALKVDFAQMPVMPDMGSLLFGGCGCCR